MVRKGWELDEDIMNLTPYYIKLNRIYALLASYYKVPKVYKNNKIYYWHNGFWQPVYSQKLPIYIHILLVSTKRIPRYFWHKYNCSIILLHLIWANTSSGIEFMFHLGVIYKIGPNTWGLSLRQNLKQIFPSIKYFLLISQPIIIKQLNF